MNVDKHYDLIIIGTGSGNSIPGPEFDDLPASGAPGIRAKLRAVPRGELHLNDALPADDVDGPAARRLEEVEVHVGDQAVLKLDQHLHRIRRFHAHLGKRAVHALDAPDLLPGEPNRQIYIVHQVERAGVFGIVHPHVLRMDLVKRLAGHRPDRDHAPDFPGVDALFRREQRAVVPEAEADHDLAAARFGEGFELRRALGGIAKRLLDEHVRPRLDGSLRHRDVQLRGRQHEHRVRPEVPERVPVIRVQPRVRGDPAEFLARVLRRVRAGQIRAAEPEQHLRVALSNGAEAGEQQPETGTIPYFHAENPPSTTRLCPVT